MVSTSYVAVWRAEPGRHAALGSSLREVIFLGSHPFLTYAGFNPGFPGTPFHVFRFALRGFGSVLRTLPLAFRIIGLRSLWSLD